MKISIKDLRKIIRESIDEMKMSESMHDENYEDLNMKLDNLVDDLESEDLADEEDVISGDIKNHSQRILDRIKL